MVPNKLALGTVQFGLDYGVSRAGQIPAQEAFKIVDFALKQSVDVLDTATAYGTSEEVIGEFIKKTGTSPRVVSKYTAKKGQTIKEVLKESLKRLNLPSLYGYLIHNFLAFKKNPDIWKELQDLKAQGLIEKIGFSLYYPEELDFLREQNIEFDLVQVPFSVFDQRFLPNFAELKKRGIEIHVRSVFLQGLVFKDPKDLEGVFCKLKQKLTKLRAIANEIHVPLSALCINFACAQKAIDKVIIGVDTLTNLKENIDSLTNMPASTMDKLSRLREDDEQIILPINWKKEIRLGILGMSKGNGHPYSWSAIFNGYDPKNMATCPFPIIPQYLSKQQFPKDTIPFAKVTHIWTQDKAISEHIAKAAKIPHIVDHYEDMIGQVDAILLARDDAENHFTMAKTFLEAGLPVYIDKPLAFNVKEAENILAAQKYPGQVFSCSALKYAKEFQNPDGNAIGILNKIEATVAKDWDHYAIHIIDPVLQIIGDQGEPMLINREEKDSQVTASFQWSSGLLTTFTCIGQAGKISITLKGTKGEEVLSFHDTFAAFKSSLEAFIAIIRKEARPIPKNEMIRTVKILELGRKESTSNPKSI